MKYAMEMLIDNLKNLNILPVLVIVAVALIFNYKKIVEFLEERKKAKIVKLSEALKCEHVSGLTRSHLEEELVTEQFKVITRISLEKEFREALIQAHNNTRGELNFIHFKRALPHTFYKESKLEVKISFYEEVSYWFNLTFGLVLAFSGLIIMWLPSQIKEINIIQLLSVLGMGVFFIATAFFMLSQTFSVISARKVSKVLDKTHDI